MSTLQHTPQQALRTQSRHLLALAAVVLLAAAAAVTIALSVSGANSSSSTGITGSGTGVMQGTPKQQLQVVSGARYRQPDRAGQGRAQHALR
jgi:hypothetical protein